MLIGHYGVALAVGSTSKAPPLGVLFIATQLMDLAFFTFLLVGVENMLLVPNETVMNAMSLYHIPYSHSLIASVCWGIILGLGVFSWRKSRTQALIAGAVVVSHWFIDLLVHRPDLTFAQTAPPFMGLGLWNHPSVEIPLELSFAYGGLAIFVLRTRATTFAGRLSPIVLAVAMGLVQGTTWGAAQPLKDSAPSPELSWLSLFYYVSLTLIAWWMANNRELGKPGVESAFTAKSESNP